MFVLSLILPQAKRPHEVTLAEVKRPQEVVTMNIKDSLKFGVMIGLLEVHKVTLLHNHNPNNIFN